jgi:epoxyqueuosine reductase
MAVVVGAEGHFYNRHMKPNMDAAQWLAQLQAWSQELGFSQIGVSGIDLSSAEPGLLAWLAAGFQGDMDYMARHGLRRARPAELVPGTVSVLTARMDYLPRHSGPHWQQTELARLQQPTEAVVSIYARGRDYHKVLRQRLQQLATRLADAVGPLGYRVFTDSAPVLEAELAQRSGQGWRGKHTLVLHREAGSLFFLGEIYLDMALPPTPPVTAHCGSCSACLNACPTQAIVAPYRLDARRCISYLTIEHAGAIPEDLRPLLGNRIYGCDDCQLVCPWNKFAHRSSLPDFDPREGMTGAALVTLFAWGEAEFLQRTEGSAIRRIGHARWLRNLAVALGNALRLSQHPAEAAVLRAALTSRTDHPDPLVREHVHWALRQDERAV